MKVRILGSGGSFGSPLAWQRNGKIDINNQRNFRTRSSVLVNINETNILIDTSPDLRTQFLKNKIKNVSFVYLVKQIYANQLEKHKEKD